MNFAFQFHKGTIKTINRVLERTLHLSFNSIKVRLKQVIYENTRIVFEFQFHKGTIKTLVYCLVLVILSRFNSIKVRLKLSYEYYSSFDKNTFQFHKGTIKTDPDFASQVLAHLFQFHKGTSKTHVSKVKLM